MAKTKTPFLSLGSRGSVGGVLTSQKGRGTTILRESPKPTDPYSLKQAYQRWDYKDYAYLWTLLSNSEKQVYRTKASRYHITGFSQWMRENLKTLPNLAGRWHLDEATGAIAYDSSKNSNNGVIVGASSTNGLISRARYFDGLNDEVQLGSPADLNITHPLSIEAFVRPIITTNHNIVSGSDIHYRDTYILALRPVAGAMFHWGVNYGGFHHYIRTGTFTDNIWYHLVGTFDGTTLLMYINGVQYSPGENVVPRAFSFGNVIIGGQTDAAFPWYKGRIDEVAIHTEVLTPATILRHSVRRYLL